MNILKIKNVKKITTWDAKDGSFSINLTMLLCMERYVKGS